MLIPFKTYKVEFKAGGFTPESIKLIKKHRTIQKGVKEMLDNLQKNNGNNYCNCPYCNNINNISDKCSIVIVIKTGISYMDISGKGMYKVKDLNIMANELLIILQGDITNETIDAILNGEIGE